MSNSDEIRSSMGVGTSRPPVEVRETSAARYRRQRDEARATPNLGVATTKDLLEELRLRGDFAMTVMPSTERGADGAALSALAGALLRASDPATLNAKRGD